ncbi:hypothetical protein HXX76_011410 [Chlamydomonas incerta]|uniref:Uncharacterized protein n=1 Tax=Chlamydomonas incerta TaxID=51695 RepID=A0A835SYA2_CHLIN|nr:hypothetical protein HXX76_011410 [Chlamydomonas incerta]|eukprot:KAG2428705.1 hypothetical protein HXX76_011410 [Chlamydomonas incerta]
MPSSVTLLDLLSVLPDDARGTILGGRFSVTYAGCRLACKALRELHDSSVAHAALFLDDGINAAAWQQGQVRSPLSRFPGCASLELHLEGLGRDNGRQVSLAFVGTTAAVRQQITCLKVGGVKYDVARVVDALAGRLPALEELELRGFDIRGGAAHKVGRGQLVLCTIADFFPRLRRLVLPVPLNTTPPGLGALAACAQLRELTLSTPKWSGPLELMRPLLEGLTQLQQLERLTLHRFQLDTGDEQLLTQLLTTHRPPNLLSFKLTDMDCADQLARAVLAAADQLQQLTVPELVIGHLELGSDWRPPQYLQPGDPLPRLVARCGEVELCGLQYGWRRPAPGWDPAPVLAVVRLMGLPGSLDLEHGEAELQATQAQELASRGAAVGAAEAAGPPAGGPAAPPAPAERRQTRQMTRLQQQQQQQQGVRSQQLQLATATPEQVLLAAVDELAAEAAAQAGRNRGDGGGGSDGSEAAGGHLVLLRGALPLREGSMGWEAWTKLAVAHCVQLAVQERARQQLPGRRRGAGGALPAAGPPSSARELERCWELTDCKCEHAAAPAGGALLLGCGTHQRAAELAALLSGAAGESSVQVLADMWARAQPGGGSGISDACGGGSSSSSSNRQVVNEDALRQLLVLDYGVGRLWDCATVRMPSRAESGSDSGTDSASDDDDDDDGTDDSDEDDVEEDDLVW